MQVFFQPDDDKFMVHRTSHGVVFGVPNASPVDVLHAIRDADGVPKFHEPHPQCPYLYVDRIAIYGRSEDSVSIRIHYEAEQPIGHA